MGNLRDSRLQALAIVLAVALFVFGWMTRYEPIETTDRGPWVLDRWTGKLCTVGSGEIVCFAKP